MIYFIETMMGGSNHLMVNSSMAKILSARGPLVFYGDRAQYDKIKSLTPEANISFKKIRVQGNPALWKLPFFISYHLLVFMVLLLKSKRKQDIIFVSCIFPVTHYFLKIMKKIFRGKKMIVALHGEVEFTQGNKKKILRLLGAFLRKALLVSSDRNTKYVVFGDSIKMNMLKEKLVREDALFVIDHPYHYEADIPDESGEPVRPAVFGTVGVASLQKNSQLIFSLAALVKSHVPDPLVFKIVGNLTPEVKAFANSDVIYSTENRFVDSADFEKSVTELDYILFFYDNNYYRFTASGAFFDAIRFEKPVIAIRNDYIDYYFGKLGDIGYLCDSLEEVGQTIASIVSGAEAERYVIQKQMLKKAKQTLSTNNIGADFWRQAESFY